METINYKDEFNKLLSKYKIKDSSFVLKFSKFMVNNQWFGMKREFYDGELLIDSSDWNKNISKIEFFCENYNLYITHKIELLEKKLNESLPKTQKALKTFKDDFPISEEVNLALLDFIISFFPDEIQTLTDNEISYLLIDAYRSFNKKTGDVFTTFLEWTRKKYNTSYKLTYEFKQKKRATFNGAYDANLYLKLIYYLFAEEYIKEKSMYKSAAKNQDYVDTWLYISLCILNEIRNTDYKRIPHPVLHIDPTTILNQVIKDEFKDDDAKKILYTVIDRLNNIKLVPNKTKKHSGISNIVFNIPVSCETHIGTLFAIAESHYQLRKHYFAEETPFIKPVSDYKTINRRMGSDIGDIFLKANFKIRASTKFNLQQIFEKSEQILMENELVNIKGYFLASLARSHKSKYGDYSKTTYVYLKDLKACGITPELVAKEMLERGVLSTIPSMLLKSINNEEYAELTMTEKTSEILNLNISPIEVERLTNLANEAIKKSVKITKKIINTKSKEEILSILHKIGCSDSPSKEKDFLCLMTAMNKLCPYMGKNKKSCISCEYEISTKSTLFLLLEEFYRLKEESDKTNNKNTKAKNIFLAKELLLPKLEEIIICAKEQYGEEAENELNTIIKEVINEKQRHL